MQTTLARRQRRRRALGRRPTGRGRNTVGQALLIVVIALILTTGALAAAGALVAVSAYNHYAAPIPSKR
jgi:hypothetical protein